MCWMQSSGHLWRYQPLALVPVQVPALKMKKISQQCLQSTLNFFLGWLHAYLEIK